MSNKHKVKIFKKKASKESRNTAKTQVPRSIGKSEPKAQISPAPEVKSGDLNNKKKESEKKINMINIQSSSKEKPDEIDSNKSEDIEEEIATKVPEEIPVFLFILKMIIARKPR